MLHADIWGWKAFENQTWEQRHQKERGRWKRGVQSMCFPDSSRSCDIRSSELNSNRRRLKLWCCFAVVLCLSAQNGSAWALWAHFTIVTPNSSPVRLIPCYPKIWYVEINLSRLQIIFRPIRWPFYLPWIWADSLSPLIMWCGIIIAFSSLGEEKESVDCEVQEKMYFGIWSRSLDQVQSSSEVTS